MNSFREKDVELLHLLLKSKCQSGIVEFTLPPPFLIDTGMEIRRDDSKSLKVSTGAPVTLSLVFFSQDIILSIQSKAASSAMPKT